MCHRMASNYIILYYVIQCNFAWYVEELYRVEDGGTYVSMCDANNAEMEVKWSKKVLN